MFDDKCIILPISRMFASVSTPSKAQGTITGENINVSLLSRSTSNCFSGQIYFLPGTTTMIPILPISPITHLLWTLDFSREGGPTLWMMMGILNPDTWSFQIAISGGTRKLSAQILDLDSATLSATRLAGMRNPLPAGEG